MDIRKSISETSSRTGRFIKRHYAILGAGAAAATASAFVFAPWMALPISSYVSLFSVFTGVQRDKKRGLETAKMEGLLWQRPHAEQKKYLRFLSGGISLAYAGMIAFNYYEHTLIPPHTQQDLWERVKDMDHAKTLQRGTPFEINMNGSNFRLVVAPPEPDMPADTYDADITYTSSSALRNQGPVRREGDYFLRDLSNPGLPPPR